MKLDIRIEDGEPIIFFVDEITFDQNIMCYSASAEHNYATRGYMRGLKKPETPGEFAGAWRCLLNYGNSQL